MKDNKFFRIVWRINSVLLFIAGALFLTFIIYEISKDFINSHQSSESEIVENIAPDPENKENWVIGNSINVTGSDYLMLPLVSENKEVPSNSFDHFDMFEGYKKYYGNFSKNILFLNKKLNNSFWLFDDINQLILETSLIPNTYDNDVKTEFILYKIITKDTNQDHIINKDDDPSLYMSFPDGSNIQKIIDKYDKIITFNLTQDNQLLLVFQKDRIAISKLIQISPYKVLSTNELPKIE